MSDEMVAVKDEKWRLITATRLALRKFYLMCYAVGDSAKGQKSGMNSHGFGFFNGLRVMNGDNSNPHAIVHGVQRSVLKASNMNILEVLSEDNPNRYVFAIMQVSVVAGRGLMVPARRFDDFRR